MERGRGRQVALRLAGALVAVAAGFCACGAGGPGLDAGQVEAVKAAWQALGSAAVQAHPAAALPAGVEFERIDVSERMRSASFGHTTTLLVPLARADAGTGAARQFWVEYGKSTNAPARLFGPFPVSG
ncbi:MAG TPA: hypothetical protein VMK66_05915 [Myxococcales bacterium]|nr:hypothetical protein [Myxococcales bacterium]